MKTSAKSFTILLAIFILSSFIFAQSAFCDEGDIDEGDNEINEKGSPKNLSGQNPFAYTSFTLFYNLTQYIGNDPYDNLRQTEIEAHHIYLGGSYAIIPNKLSISADFSLNIISGNRSDFTFDHFGLGTIYTFYNKRPVMVSAGIDFNLMNQSLMKTFSADVFNIRPYLVTGVSLWRFFISPYLGIPIYIDINSGDDMPSTGCGAASGVPDRGRCFPDRKPNYGYDESPFGIDYGVPIAFKIIGGLFLNLEPTGVTWLYPGDYQDTTLWITPGITYRSSFIITAGVKLRVYTTDPVLDKSRSWQIMLQGGASF